MYKERRALQQIKGFRQTYERRSCFCIVFYFAIRLKYNWSTHPNTPKRPPISSAAGLFYAVPDGVVSPAPSKQTYLFSEKSICFHWKHFTPTVSRVQFTKKKKTPELCAFLFDSRPRNNIDPNRRVQIQRGIYWVPEHEICASVEPVEFSLRPIHSRNTYLYYVGFHVMDFYEPFNDQTCLLLMMINGRIYGNGDDVTTIPTCWANRF